MTFESWPPAKKHADVLSAIVASYSTNRRKQAATNLTAHRMAFYFCQLFVIARVSSGYLCVDFI